MAIVELFTVVEVPGWE